MELYELTFALEESTNQDQIRVRAWIDSDMDAGLGNEAELPLVKASGARWSGTFTLRANKPFAFAYRIGLLTEPGARWSLVIRRRERAESVLLEDADVVTTRKEWLLGTCDVGS
jgi:hypothetical protein